MTKLVAYPRRCQQCQSVFAHSSSFTRHRRTGLCEKRATQNVEASTAPSTHVEITQNNTQNNNTQNNVYNIYVQASELSAILKPEKCGTSKKEQSAMESFIKLLLDNGYKNKSDIITLIQEHGDTAESILESFPSQRDIIERLNTELQTGRIPLEEDADDNTYINLTPRQLLLHFAKMFWKNLFLPPLNGDKCIENLVRRPVRSDEKDKDYCQIRKKVDVDEKGRVQTLKSFCQARNWKNLARCSPEDLYARDIYSAEIFQIAHWTREHWDDVVTRDLHEIANVICEKLRERGDDAHELIQKKLVPFAISEKLIDIPQKVKKELEKEVALDAGVSYVSAWRKLSDFIEQTDELREQMYQRARTVQTKSVDRQRQRTETERERILSTARRFMANYVPDSDDDDD